MLIEQLALAADLLERAQRILDASGASPDIAARVEEALDRLRQESGIGQGLRH
ncbi:hypothetical protein [Sphingomonas ginkgonis]|uniref:hypothetical protein n=1 Tax=Sphingomonas ginkgonis TaxID=2315330 RepID=UPI0016397D7E|nr:hypothetical protein [Sphingomonas ginkgonis]